MNSPVGTQGRRIARERALELGYELEVRHGTLDELLAGLPAPPDPFALSLARGVEDHRHELDGLLGRFSQRWAVDRMPVVDRAILRLGCFELVHASDTPTGVVISEAVELAQEYSTEHSGRFVNGLLSRIADEVRPASAKDEPASAKVQPAPEPPVDGPPASEPPAES
ncbi:MAG TPA: transcription antitermination factor NusB [Acidimicrobiia bacterium]|nr:transcription antitermination factor NusB [Acidimicrobiia bacterium]